MNGDLFKKNKKYFNFLINFLLMIFKKAAQNTCLLSKSITFKKQISLALLHEKQFYCWLLSNWPTTAGCKNATIKKVFNILCMHKTVAWPISDRSRLLDYTVREFAQIARKQ